MLTVDIGLGPHLPAPELRRLEPADLADWWPVPQRTSHKYTRGVLGIAAGSAQYPGAALLCTQAAAATGVGMIRYLGPQEICRLVNLSTPEAVCSQGSVGESRVQAWLVGPGATGDPDQQARVPDLRKLITSKLAFSARTIDLGSAKVRSRRLAHTALKYAAPEESTLVGKPAADHVRSSLMLIGDGVTPGNEARGYVLRRLLRRAVRSMRLLGFEDPALPELMPVSRDRMGETYTSLHQDWERISKIAYAEEDAFRQTLGKGTQIFESAAVKVKDTGAGAWSDTGTEMA